MKLAVAPLLLAGWTLLLGQLEAKTLNILLLANASTQDVIQRLIKEYQQQNPETDFNVSIVQANSITAKLNTLVTAGQPPDIVEITTAYIQNYAAQALDLGQYTPSQELLERYLPSYRPFFTSGNKVLGIPIEATANGLFYNKKLFEKAGVKVPLNESEIWTWDQFKQALATVMRLPECRMGVAYDCTVQRWSSLLYQANGRWIDAAGQSFLPDRTAAENALAFFRSLVEAKLVPSSSWPGKTDAATTLQNRGCSHDVVRQLATEKLDRRRDNLSVRHNLFPQRSHPSDLPGRRVFLRIRKIAKQRRSGSILTLVGQT
jgi:alpha-1,4-digalacturonate transport system substrate-binding protein